MENHGFYPAVEKSALVAAAVTLRYRRGPHLVDEWGMLNVLCLMLPYSAPVGTSITCDAVRTAVSGILRQQDWKPALDLITNERRLLAHRL